MDALIMLAINTSWLFASHTLIRPCSSMSDMKLNSKGHCRSETLLTFSSLACAWAVVVFSWSFRLRFSVTSFWVLTCNLWTNKGKHAVNSLLFTGPSNTGPVSQVYTWLSASPARISRVTCERKPLQRERAVV